MKDEKSRGKKVKSLSERISERAQLMKPSGKNRASFLAVRDDVKKALADGWPVKTIWDTLRSEGKISFGYDAFIGYTNRLIRNVEKQTNKPPDGKSPEIKGFSFNPTPNKEDLF